MPPSNSLKNTAKSLKTLQSKVYFSIEIIISCHKTNRITYHEMLDHLSRCESEIKIATDPARLQSLQGLKVHIRAIMQGLEDDMGRTMQTVQCMRVTNARTQKALERIKRALPKERGAEGTRRSARIKEQHCRLIAGKPI